MIYCVELGEIEVIVELIRQGDTELGLPPLLMVETGTDWEGNAVYISAYEEEQAKQWVLDNYSHEVWD